MNSKTFRRISSGLLSLILVLQVFVQPVLAIQNTNDLPTETKTEETKEDHSSETVISPAIKKKLSPLELNYVNRLEDNSFAFLRGPFVISSKDDFDIKNYTFVEKDEKGKVSIIKGEDLEQFSNISELNKIIKDYKKNYELYKEEKLQELEPVEALLKINYKDYDELSVPLVINNLENKYESTKNKNLTLKRDAEELTKEIFVNSLKDLEELSLNFKGEEELKDLDIKKVEKVYSGEEDEDTIAVEKVFEEVLEEAHKDKNKVTSLNLDELDPGYKYIFTLTSKQVKDDNKVLIEITSLEKDQDKTEVEELGKTIVEEEKETESNEATEAKDATEESKENKETETVIETEKENSPQENKINKEETEAATEENEKVQEFEKAVEEAKEEIQQDPNNKEEKKGLVEGIKKLFGLTDLQKADKELKAALKDEKNGLVEIQNLLNSFEEKYELSKEEQLKLMDDNGDAIKALIAKDADENFRPSMLLDMSPEVNPQAVGAGNLTDDQKANLANKKFHVKTIFKTSNAGGAIQPYQYFKIHLDDELMVKKGTTLAPIKYNGRVIAKPSYDSEKNIITYNIEGTIPENISVPLDIPVDYNPEKITLDNDGTFTVINKVSGLGIVNPPKDLVPQRIDKNGNPAGSIIEPGRHDVIQIFDNEHDRTYSVNIDAHGKPAVENGKIQGINWTVKVHSTDDLKNLGFRLNLTAVEGSGLKEIKDVKLNGQEVTLKKQLEGATGIVDSKHHTLDKNATDLLYTFYTPVERVQSAYMLDVSGILTNKSNILGAARLVLDDAYKADAISGATPTSVGMNNRTTIQGKFKSANEAEWTVTDQVSSGDEKGSNPNAGLPLETRKLEGSQEFKSGKSVVYGIDTNSSSSTYGQMVVKRDLKNDLTTIPAKETDPSGAQAVGNIAVYKIDTKLTDATSGDNTAKDYRLSGVSLSKYKDVIVEQEWSLPEGQNMPAQKIEVIDKVTGEVITKKEVGEETGDKRTITIPDVKFWDFKEENDQQVYIAKKLGIKQNLPTKPFDVNGQQYKYSENSNYYKEDTKTYLIRNSAVKEGNTLTSFTVIKIDKNKDKDGKDIKLAGADYYLLGAGVGVTTDKNGEATFRNIGPGNYVLKETKAPNGYKLDQDIKNITITENGEIIVTGNNAVLTTGSSKTQMVEHSNYPNWPDFMNAMHYGKVDSNGNVEFYVYLKPKAQQAGGSTNKNTDLNITLPGVSLTDKNVTAYDVHPFYRDQVRKAMVAQDLSSVNNITSGSNLINDKRNKKVITGKTIQSANPGENAYQIYFPKERFADDWGFLVKVTGNIGDKNSTNLSYDWLVHNSPQDSNIRQNVTLSKNTNKDDIPTITITNEAFKQSEIKISKFANEFNADGKRARVPNAEFVLKDSKGNVIANKLTDADGNVNFGKHIPGTYTIEEINAPDGYIKSNVYYEVTVDEKNQVTYKPKFIKGSGQPVIGEDYWIEKGKETQTTVKPEVTNVSQRLEYNEGTADSWGRKAGVWEAYMFESLKYHADITLSDGTPGKRFEIQFDPNLDFTQYFSGFPKIRKGGKDIADPYFDYNTNLLTYVFNKNSSPGQTIVSIDLKGMIPDKYYFQNSGTKPFKITVAPGQSGVNGQTIKKDIVADYGRYDTGWGQPSQSYYFRDIYKGDDGQWYVTAMAYFNPMADSRTSKTLKFNWMSTNYDKNTRIARQEGKGYKPAYDLVDVKVYRTEPNLGTIKVGNDTITVNYNMPLSFGVRPEQDPNTYSLLYHTGINPNKKTSSSANGVRLEYDPGKIKTTGGVHTTFPLTVRMPNISPQREGFIVEQTFKITDINNFINLSRIFYMNNGALHDANGMESAFANSANFNTATADQTGEEIPKYYEEITGLINKKYIPGKFKITKLDQADRNKKLSGTIFVLKPEEGTPIYRTTDNNGEINFTGLAPGRYILEEFRAPSKDYIKSDKQWQVFVFNDGNVRIAEAGVSGSTQSYVGKNINIEITNKPKGQDFVIYKKDDKGNPLQGAKFKLTKHNDSNFKAVEAESDGQGLVKFGQLQNGTYIIEEVSPPSGYKPLNKKWVLVIDEKGKRVYNYREQSGTTNKLDSILEKENVNWVDVGNRSLEGWNLYDNRRADWTANYPTPFKLGTRIVGINTNDKYVIQRYILNPESLKIGATTATIHREKPEYPNMDWYDGNAKANTDYQVFTLDKAVTGNIEDIRLAEYNPTNITDKVTASPDNTRFGEPTRLKLEFPETTKPIVVDIKVPYKDFNEGVGTGMDWTENGVTYWKSDYYERVNIIKKAGPVLEQSKGIQGSYISDDSLDVTNELQTFKFTLKKVKEGNTPSPIQGATFKLTGPGKSTEEREMTTGQDGTISFDNLKPGEYKLVETQPAPGYEQANNDWIVTVSKDGKTFIKENKEARSTSNTNISVGENSQSVESGSIAAALRSARLDTLSMAMGGLEIGDEIVGKAVGASNIDAISEYGVDSSNATITVSAGAVNTTDGSRDVKVKITPKTKQTGSNRSHWVLLVDRSKDFSGKNNLDNNINKFLTDLRAKADTPGAEVYISMIEYSDVNNMNKLLISKKNIKDFDNANRYSYTMGTVSNFDSSSNQCDLNEQNVTVRDYLSTAGIDRRHNSNTRDGAVNLEKTVNANLGNLTNEAYDNKYVINFAAFNTNNAVRNATGGSNYNKFRQFESMWAFFTKGYKRVYVHTDQENTELSGTKGDFYNYVNGNADYKKVYLTARDRVRNKGYKKAREFGPYVQKDVLDTILNNNANFSSQGKEESLLKNGNLDISLNNNIRLQSYKVLKNGNQTQGQDNPTDNFINLNNIALGVGESLELDYKIILDQSASNNEDHIIHNRMNYKADNQTSDLDPDKMITRRNASTPTTFTVTYNTPENGTLSVSPTTAKAGDTITVTATPNTNYKLKSLYYRDGNGNQVTINGNSFEMPAANVNVFAEFELDTQPQPTQHTIKNYLGPNGIVAGVPNIAFKDQHISLTIRPDDGYTVERIWLEDEAGRTLQELTNATGFIMPDKNVVIKATFKRTEFNITTSVNDPNLGSVKVDKNKAAAGDKVTVTVTPKDNTVEVTDIKAGNISIGPQLQNGKYTFEMPANDVIVSVTFNKKTYTTYPVGLEGNNERGWITITQIYDSNKHEAREGDVVKFRVDAKQGWEVIKDQVYVRKSNGDKIIPDFDGVNGSFTMPATSVTIVASSYKEETIPEGSFIANVDKGTTGGDISVSQRINKPGEKIRITLTPWEGYKNTSQRVTYSQGGNPVTVLSDEQGYYFIMPKAHVTVSGTFVRDNNPGEYKVNLGQVQGGRVSASPISANKGDEITLSAVADKGYVFEGYTVKDANGQPVKLTGNKFKMPAGAVTVSASFKYAGEEIPTDKVAQITNKQVGLEFKIFKHDFRNRPLEGATFELYNADESYNITDKDAAGKEKASMSGISDKDGIVKFFKGGNEVKLTPGYYVLREVTSPQGFKKINADWKIRVYEDSTGAMKAEYKGPENTPTNFVTSEKAKDANTTNDPINGSTYLKNAGSGIKYASKMTYINTESKTFIQRIYVDTRGYTGSEKVNVKITPVVKREEIDTPGALPKTIKDGVKTAYRSTYQIAGLTGDPDDTKLNDILSIYDLSDPNVSMINTARWRPFDWGFDEDQLNLDKGVYYIDVEGFYDDNITEDKIGKIEMNIEFLTERYFYSQKFDKDKNQYVWEKDGSYQSGAAALGGVYEKDTVDANGDLHKKGDPTDWGKKLSLDNKYPNWIGKRVIWTNGKEYQTGKIDSPDGVTKKDIAKVTTTIDIKPLYSSNKTNQISQDGMSILNDEETYNVTFSKHGQDDPNYNIDSEEVTKRRLEGAVFKLQEERLGRFIDVPDSTVASAFNGYFGFRGLSPGRYRLMEVKAPKDYKPIDGPLLYFTVETIKTNSGKIVHPETGQVVDIKSITIKFSDDDPEAHTLESLQMVDKDGKIVYIKDAKSTDINVETTKIINPHETDPAKKQVLLKELKIVGANKNYNIKDAKIVPGSSGYISLEYDKANGVYQYVPEKSTSEKDGKLVDFVTSATAKNMGKIINTKPGKGQVKLKKIDQDTQAIKKTDLRPGAQFKLTNILNGTTTTKEVDGEGEIVFDQLPIGQYRLEEVESPNGYINNHQIWEFTVGGKELDPYAGDPPQRRNDISDKITLSESNMKVLNPENKDNAPKAKGEIHPHLGEAFEFENKFKIEGAKINPGDYFTLKLSDNIDLNGIFENDVDGLDMFADGVGTIAKADYNKEAGTITYTFTDYANTYTLAEFSNKLAAFINLNKVKNSNSNEKVGFGIKDKAANLKDIKVVYDSMTSRENNGSDFLNLGSKIVKFNPDTGEFVHYYYINRDQKDAKTGPLKFYYSSDQKITDFKLGYYLMENKDANSINGIMPESFGVDERNGELPKFKLLRDKNSLEAGKEEIIDFTGGISKNQSYIFKVTGKVADTNKTAYEGHGKLDKVYRNPEYFLYVTRDDKVYGFANSADAKAELNIQAVNPENKIKFLKVDQDGKPLAGAKFSLNIQDKDGNWNDYQGGIKQSGDDGIVEFKQLKPGKYQLVETQAPEGYEKLQGAILEFEVDASGRIKRNHVKSDTTTNNNPVGSGESAKVEEAGITPIPVVNKKPQKIKFEKVDATEKKTKLAGAEFEVWYKANKDDKDYTTKLKVYEKKTKDKTERLVLKDGDNVPEGYTHVEGDKFITGKDGLVEFYVLDTGYYALKEVKAPKKYIAPRDYVKEFSYLDGKIKVDDKVQSGEFVTEVNVEKTKSYALSWSVINAYATSITMKYNTEKMPITYTKDKAKLTLSGLPPVSQPTRDNAPKEAISITAYLTDGTNKSTQKTITLNLSDYGSRDYATKVIDLFALVKELEGKTDDADITTNKTLVLSMSSKLYLNTELDLGSKVVIGDNIKEDRSFHIGTKGNAYEDHSYSFTTKGTVDLTKPIEVENRKAEYPLTGGIGALIFAIIGAGLMTAAYIGYKRKKVIE